MSGPLLLDLFCGEGGAGVGYARAGFDVVGVDSEASVLRRYPFESHHGDALHVLGRLVNGESVWFERRSRVGSGETVGLGRWLGLRDFAVVHASPPCQAYSVTRHSHGREHPDLVESVRDALVATGLPYVIENVVGAPLRDPVMLCGSEFGLTARDVDGTLLRLERHRLFESNVWLMGAGGCMHDRRVLVGGIYGGGSSDRRHARARGGYTPRKAVRSALLGGVDWMTLHGQAQSIPPAYTEFIGGQLLAEVGVVAV